jgi:hypothetical protein
MNTWKRTRDSKAKNSHHEQDMHNHCIQYKQDS